MRLAVLSLALLTLAACSDKRTETAAPASPPAAEPEAVPSAEPATATGAEGAVGAAPVAPSSAKAPSPSEHARPAPAAAPSAPVASVAPPKAGPPVLNRVNLSSPLRLVGTEPFWGAQLGDGRLVLEAPDRETVRLSVGQPVMAPGKATWRATNATVVLTGQACSDGMSSRTYPLTAVVQSGGITWNGCAANAAAFARAQGRESGEVR